MYRYIRLYILRLFFLHAQFVHINKHGIWLGHCQTPPKLRRGASKRWYLAILFLQNCAVVVPLPKGTKPLCSFCRDGHCTASQVGILGTNTPNWHWWQLFASTTELLKADFIIFFTLWQGIFLTQNLQGEFSAASWIWNKWIQNWYSYFK